ncbi:Ig-like domain-containing protein [Agrococcus sp. ARC_14]|uniref:Ig-like domain-containing protein n=1 Tax=Agrococcus sp. ARC_14 TaxID=2919927 RepID=UPI001F05B0F3|nr:Ig-like domain-containing protein [Agrococcus sp. ARC_14]MCH1882070.1 Ig-like domain-containing protein [Agrococcus sp. ARC_14]
MLQWVKRHRRSSTAAGLITAVSVALGVLALTYDGFTTTDVDLHDGSVWVTKTETLQLGHLNVQAQELDGAVASPSTSFDVLQDGERVLLLAHDSSTALVVDTVQLRTESPVALPPGGSIAIGGGSVVITDPAGLLWAMRFDDLAGFSPATTDPTLELEEGAVATVGRDGTIFAVSPASGTEVTLRDSPEGFEAATRERGELRSMTTPTITVVGSAPVVLDAASQTLLLPGGAVQTEADAVLQQVGDDAAEVVLATPTQLVRQPLSGGAATVEGEQGSAAEAVAPVQLGGCVYAVWPSSAQFRRDCADDGRDTSELVEAMDGSPVVFRVNRDAVVLNQVAEGSSWLLSDQLVLVDNWTDLVPPPSEETTDEEEDNSTEDRFENQPPPASEENHPPVANPDAFGARPGRATIMPVLWNDSDQDGDVLTARLRGELPEGVSVAAVENDSKLQVQVAASVTNDFSFEYEVDDGRGETASATVQVEVRGDAENAVPEPLRSATFVVEQGATVEYQVLQDWVDPDGDDLYLMDATSESGDTIQTDPSGRLVYTATGDAGLQGVQLTISDGREQATGEVTADVRERGDAPPQANADFVSTIIGREVSVRPLLNDYAPSGQPLRLALVEEAPGITMEWDAVTGVVRIVDGPIGTHYLSYVVAAGGPASSTGRIRVDIRQADDEARPIAVRDTALVPMQGEALVDLLQNDVDPAGGVLVVQAIEVESAAPVTVELIDRRLVRIRDTALDAPFQFQYTVSNGRFTETGTVEVIPVAPPTQPRAPVAVDDVATVRAGDFQSIDVLGNDFSPDGTPFELSRTIVDTSFVSDAEGVAFIAEGELRVHALEDAPSRATVTYEVADEQGNRDSASVSIQIVPRDPERNDRPTPGAVTARVLAGSLVRIPIELDGIDPDGDGVELVGYDTAPEQGEIEETGPDYFDFEAYPDAGGTVAFTYRVRDRWGAEATASVTIGIAQAADINQPPFAETDILTVRPGRAVAVPVLANDSDPDQDALVLLADELDLPPELADAEVNVERGTVDLVTPAEPGVHQFTYGVADARGMATTGLVMLTVSEDAELSPPVAIDDPVSSVDLRLGEPIDVPVLANDLDPDGDPDALTVSIVTGPGRVVPGGVQATPSEAFQVVTYRVTDIDGQSAEAFVSVPPVRDPRPVLAISEPLQIPSGEEREIALRDIVSVSTDNPPRLTTGDRVSAVNDDDSGLVVDTETLRFRSPQGYVGPASITFEVTDGTSPEDPDGSTAVLTLPIDVTASSVIAPSFAGASLQVVAGESATRFDLRSATTDPDPGDLEAMRFDELAGAATGVQAGLEGSTFVATAERTTAPGTTGAYQVRITDPYGNAITGTVLIEVVATNRQLPVAVADAAEGEQGQPIVVDVLGNDVNPFARDGVPLRVVDAQVVGGDGGATFSDRDVTVRSGQDFAGTLTVRYTIEDGTGLLERRVTGAITVTIKGRPDAPPRPNVDAVGDRQVTLTWAPPAPNGAPITGYLVQSSDGAVAQPCPSTTCVIEGLQNDVTYRFQVLAQNEVGDSDPSAASADARPDRRPEQPSPPTATRGDSQLALTWTPAESLGSPVVGYTLEIQPAAPDGTTAVSLGNVAAYTWTGLANGTAYAFRLQAHNSAPDPSDPSAFSAPEVPAGRPFPATDVSASVDRSLPDRVQMAVTWSAANGNGSQVLTYIVTSSTGLTQRVSGTAASFGNVPADGANVTFTVVAENDVGTGEPSAPTSPLRAVLPPDAPTGVRAVDGDRSAQVSWTPGARNGLRAEEVSFQVQGGPAVQSFGPGSSSGTYTGLANGETYGLEVRAVAVIDGQSYASAWVRASSQTRPFGPPPAPVISITSQVHQVTYHWAPGGTNGRALDRIEWTQNENGANMQRVSPTSGSQAQELSPGWNAHMTAVAIDVDGNVSERITIGPVAAGYAPPPQPLAAVTGSSGAVTFTYGPNGTTDRPLDRLEYVLDDGSSGWTVVRPAANGSFGMPRDPSLEACIRVRVFDTGGLESEHIVACGYALP